MQLKPTK